MNAAERRRYDAWQRLKFSWIRHHQLVREAVEPHVLAERERCRRISPDFRSPVLEHGEKHLAALTAAIERYKRL